MKMNALSRAVFSNPWKNTRQKFQSLEKILLVSAVMAALSAALPARAEVLAAWRKMNSSAQNPQPAPAHSNHPKLGMTYAFWKTNFYKYNDNSWFYIEPFCTNPVLVDGVSATNQFHKTAKPITNYLSFVFAVSNGYKLSITNFVTKALEDERALHFYFRSNVDNYRSNLLYASTDTKTMTITNRPYMALTNKFVVYTNYLNLLNVTNATVDLRMYGMSARSQWTYCYFTNIYNTGVVSSNDNYMWYFEGTVSLAANLTTNCGPYAGGHSITLSGVVLGDGDDITSVTVGGVPATITGQWTNWVTFTMPAATSAGAKDIVVVSDSLGSQPFADIYTVNPGGRIGSSLTAHKWEGVGDKNVPGQSTAVGAQNTIYGLDYHNGTLYAGGAFTNIGRSNCLRIARYDGANWNAMGSGIRQFANVNAVKGHNGHIYAAGYFTNIGGATAYAVGGWDGTNWYSMGKTNTTDSKQGLFFSKFVNGYANFICGYTGNTVIAGGYFTNTDYRTPWVNYVAKFDGQGWTNMGTGFRNVCNCGVYDPVYGKFYLGGPFTNNFPTNSSRNFNYVAEWNGTVWTNMNRGLGNRATCMAVHPGNGDLYVGGWFTNYRDSVGNSYGARYVAKWNPVTRTWTNVGAGVNNWVYAMTFDSQTNLIIAGSFTNTYLDSYWNPIAPIRGLKRIAKWDGTYWTNTGGGFSDSVLTLTADREGDALYAGGFFKVAYQEDGASTNTWYLAKWASSTVMEAGVSPSNGLAAGGYEVTIVGSDLGNGGDITNVTLCGYNVASIESQSATQVVVIAGASASGVTGDVRICSTSYGLSMVTNGFAYEGIGVVLPTLLVLGTNGVTVTSGEAPSAQKGTDFGNVPRGWAATNTLSFTNNGASLLTISGVTTNGAGAGYFRVTGIPATLAAGAAAPVTVAFDATVAGTYTAAVQVANDSTTTPYIVNLAGTAEPGRIGTVATSGVTGVGSPQLASAVAMPCPIRKEFAHYHQQHVYSPALLAAAGLTNVQITALGFRVAGADTPHVISNYLVRLKETARTGWTGGDKVMESSGLATVYSNAAQAFTLGSDPTLVLDTVFNLGAGSSLLVDCGFAGALPASMNGQIWVTNVANSVVLLQRDGADALSAFNDPANMVTNLLPELRVAWRRMAAGGLSPASSPSTGGVVVTISGTNLCNGTMGDVTSVRLCDASATVLSVADMTQIVVRANGGGVIGLGAVEIQSARMGRTALGNAFTYNAPGTIESVAPGEGTNGMAVTISGQNLCNGTMGDVTGAKLCGVAASVQSVAGSTQVVVVAGAGTPGVTGDAEVNSTLFGTTVRANAFTYAEPRMVILGKDGLPIASGAGVSSAKGTDFGIIPAGTAITNLFSITNTSLLDLTIPSWTTNEMEVGP